MNQDCRSTATGHSDACVYLFKVRMGKAHRACMVCNFRVLSMASSLDGKQAWVQRTGHL